MIYNFKTNKTVVLSQVGGKAKALIETSQAGFEVPEGFVLTVAFFQPWIDEIKSGDEWKQFLESPSKEKCDQLKARASQFHLSETQRDLLSDVLESFRVQSLFAVRSSSPEEDIEEASFAGMYDTLLGIPVARLEEAIVEIFSSTLDYRVVEYKRNRNIPIDNPRIAVVVQRQIASEVSGVAFSLNPINNCYDEAFINASFGLGESIVSGTVTPDTYIVDKVKKQILEKTISDKKSGQWLLEDGGIEKRVPSTPTAPALDDKQIFEVANMVSACEEYYDKPMDIEWAIENDKLYLLQSRPITTHIQFYPEMLTKPGEPKRLYLDFIILTQGFTESFSVMGLDVWTEVINTANQGTWPEGVDGSQFNVHGRDYLVLSNIARNLGQGFVNTVASFEQPIKEMLESVDFKKEYWAKKKSKKMCLAKKNYLKMAFRMIGPALGALIHPRRAGRKYKSLSDKVFQFLKNDLQNEESFEQVYKKGLHCFDQVAAAVAPVMIVQLAYSSIKKMFKDKGVDDYLLTLSMDLPTNPTRKMGRHMLKLASYKEFQETDSKEKFIQNIAERSYSSEFMEEYDEFMFRYGSRGFREIDVAVPRTSEVPERLFQQIKAIDLNDNQMTQVAKRKKEGYEKLLSVAKEMGKEKRFIKKAQLYNDLWGYREDPKYIFILWVGELRKRALHLGRSFVKEGRLDRVEQIFDLHIKQVIEAEKNRDLDVRTIAHKNVSPRKQLAHFTDWPKLVDSRGKIFTHKKLGENGELVGQAIAPGIVRGTAKILHSPFGKTLKKGDILIAKTTEPAWTPVFANASGVVLEIGGPIQHGAIIAREYGIPCVSGISNATKQFQDGDLLEIDGSRGTVKILTLDKCDVEQSSTKEQQEQ